MRLNKQETICVAYHLIALQRQTVYKRKASMSEACKKCLYLEQCKDNDFEKRLRVYQKVCENASEIGSFNLSLGITLSPANNRLTINEMRAKYGIKLIPDGNVIIEGIGSREE